MDGNKPARDLQIPLALDELQTQIERIGKLSEELCMRLEKVCQPATPAISMDASNKAMVSPSQAEYVDTLKGKTYAIRKIAEMLEGVMSRLEL